MNKKLLFLLLQLLLVGSLQAQPGKEAWRWYFGHKCGMDFSSGAPVGIQGIPGYYVQGGCASISDPVTGQYLLSVGGTHIYNRNNAVMYNGYNVYGTVNNTQALIVQQPGHSNSFFVFTPDQLGSTPKGVSYSVVDMNQQGGLGAVVLKNKTLLPSPATEKITAVRHCNGVDYWVLAHAFNSNAMHAYLLNSSGLDTTPVISNVGVVHQLKHGTNAWCFEMMGVLKASPNGKKLVSAIQSDSIPVMEVFDFDNATGVVSNPIQFNYPGRFGPYGATFSPDNSKVYCVNYSLVMQDTSFLYQYDLSSGVPSQIVASEVLVHTDVANQTGYVAGTLGELQIAPNGKIYIPIFQRDTMAVINNPNLAGMACGFQRGAVILPTSGVNIWGVPNFIDANYAGIQLNIPDIYQCGNFTSGTFDAGTHAGYQWSTGATTQTISVTSPGQYWVTVTNGQGCQRTDTVNAYVVQPLKIDTAVCDSFPANMIQQGATQYIWNDSTTNPIKDLSVSGSYYVDVTYQGGCVLRDSVILSVIASPKVDLGPPLSLCDFKLDLNASYPNTSVTWSTGATTPSITVNEPGTYWVTLVGSTGCKGSDTLLIGPPWQLVELSIPNIVTPNNDKVNDEIDFTKFQFAAFSISIYNRWGQQIFESNSVNAVWRPTGDDGTYFYVAKYELECGSYSRTNSLKGFITVIR